MPDLSDLHFRVSEDRLSGVKIGILRKTGKSISETFAYVAYFMTDGEGGPYLEEDDAYEILDEYTLGDVDAIAEEIKKQTEAVVPKK